MDVFANITVGIILWYISVPNTYVLYVKNKQEPPLMCFVYAFPSPAPSTSTELRDRCSSGFLQSTSQGLAHLHAAYVGTYGDFEGHCCFKDVCAFRRKQNSFSSEIWGRVWPKGLPSRSPLSTPNRNHLHLPSMCWGAGGQKVRFLTSGQLRTTRSCQLAIVPQPQNSVKKKTNSNTND